MNAVTEPLEQGLSQAQHEAVQQACARIAPTWPLDRMIAVNPWWEMRAQTLAAASARLAALARVNCLMPKAYYGELWLKQIRPGHLQSAARQLGESAGVEELLEHLETPEWQHHWHNVSDWLDSHRDRQHRMAWRDEITHQISQFCASFFQSGSPFNENGEDDHGLYRAWLEVTRQDRGIEILMREQKLGDQFGALPDDYQALFATAFAELEVDQLQLADYLHALLLDVNGWASWAAYGRWQSRLYGSADHTLVSELLAIRLGWELVLWRHCLSLHGTGMQELRARWRHQWRRLPRLLHAHREAQRLTWVWQYAAELAYQESLHTQLRLPASGVRTGPVLQAVFCIDVRSEPMRRALEAQDAAIETLGYAGFFGLPLEYRPGGTGFCRPQLPGLLKPDLQVTESPAGFQALAARRQSGWNRSARWSALSEAPPAAFSLVEAAGLRYACKLFTDTFAPGRHRHPVNDLPGTGRWLLSRDNKPLTTAEKAGLAAGVLNTMGLTRQFAPLVLLVGHGSRSRNNPQAAGLDCGACGGQTGEINVRVLAELLNAAEVRELLVEQGISIPSRTRFLPALHNTTTEDIDCFDGDPGEQVKSWLNTASERVRAERAGRLNPGGREMSPATLAACMRRRANDWSEVRPEWGLAGNASFIVAPRHSTRHLDLAGRTFLHDYDWRQDRDFRVLELIMTAPMVVTHWINMQYNASVTDNLKYGSGNKILHNVVGGHLGVFEGNGGDLRIGLPLQSLHDGEHWVHQPLRLSVYLAAPRAAIAGVLERHRGVADLVDNDWLFLFQLDSDEGAIARYYRSGWQPVGGDQLQAGPQDAAAPDAAGAR